MNTPSQSPGGVFMRSPGGVRGDRSSIDWFTHIYDICLDSSGNIIVGGMHKRVVGSITESASVVRLDSEGDLDTTFDSWGSISRYTYAVAVDSSDKVIVCGSNGYISGSNGYIARYNTDGSIDSTFRTGTGFDGTTFTGFIDALYIDDSDRVIVGGCFNLYNGTSVNSIVRLNTDGSIDSTFNCEIAFPDLPSTQSPDEYKSIVYDGDIIVLVSPRRLYGCFIYRLNSDGTIKDGEPWVHFHSTDLCVEGSGKILIGGLIHETPDSQWNYPSDTINLLRVDTNLQYDSTYAAGSIEDNPLRVDSICVDESDNSISAGNSVTNHYVYKYSSGRVIQNTSYNFNYNVQCVCLDSGGKIIAGGDFNSYNGTSYDHILRLNTDFTIDSTFRDGV